MSSNLHLYSHITKCLCKLFRPDADPGCQPLRRRDAGRASATQADCLKTSCRSPRAHRQEQCFVSPIGGGAPHGQASLSAGGFAR